MYCMEAKEWPCLVEKEVAKDLDSPSMLPHYLMPKGRTPVYQECMAAQVTVPRRLPWYSSVISRSSSASSSVMI